MTNGVILLLSVTEYYSVHHVTVQMDSDLHVTECYSVHHVTL